jgi:very-short-patch-repair endonuclease
MSRDIPFEKSFASHEKSKFWSDKNELKPYQVLKFSGKKYLFNCNKCNHIFLRPLDKIYNNKEHCSYCVIPSKLLCDDKECIFCFERSFASHIKSKFWSNKNKLLPRDVIKLSGSKYIFDCNKCNHEIGISLSNINAGNWCSYCVNKKLCNNNDCNSCFEKSFASHEKSKFVVDKNINLRNIFKNSHEKILFNCNNCNHNFECSLGNINFDKWCPYCCIPSRLLCNDNDCKFCFEKSFASHEKSIFWSNKNGINPRQALKFSNNKYLFDCNLCNHNNEIALNNINAGNWCSYCCYPPQKLCKNNECKSCFEKSFASHKKSKFWSINNIDINNKNINPRYIFKKTTNKYLFNCNKCNHEFLRPLNNIDDDKEHCSYCCIPSRLLCNDNDCKFCFEKSFASHEKNKYWSNKNELKPRNVLKFSNNKYYFDCNNCNNNFNTSLSNISQGKWCPYCVNKTEQKLYDKLKLIYPELIQQYKVEWCKNINYLPFDFCIEEYKIIIELDGLQHFEQVSNWNSPEDNQQRDKFKMKCANDNNYSIIRILQEDVFYDTFDYINEIKQAIQKIIDDKNIQNIFICKNNEYDIFQ